MDPLVKSGLLNSVVDLVLLVVFIMLFPVTKGILILSIPLMGWGFIVLAVIFIIQVFTFNRKAEEYEKLNGGE